MSLEEIKNVKKIISLIVNIEDDNFEYLIIPKNKFNELNMDYEELISYIIKFPEIFKLFNICVEKYYIKYNGKGVWLD